MHFDDRLRTVLRLRAEGKAVQRIQYRQLLDLLGASPIGARGPVLDAAFDRLGELAEAISPAERAAMIADRGLRLRSPRLVAALATGEPAVASAVLRRAELTLGQWLDLVPALPADARVHLRERRDLPEEVAALLARLGANHRGLPQAEDEAGGVVIEAEAADLAVSPAPATAEPPPPQVHEAEEASGIGAIVRRIEAYRRTRHDGGAPLHKDSPRLPLGEEHPFAVPFRTQAFDFATNVEGRIAWADPGVAAMVVGLRLGGEQARGSDGLAETIRRRQPVLDCAITIDGAPAIAGDWRLDATPWFDPLTGRYIGHRGRLRRIAGVAAPANQPVRITEAERIRQLLHELRTPVNAIQGFAEVIQQQLFGPTPHEYRALAAGIAGDAARMLSAFEELERLARLDSKAMELTAGESDLTAVVATTVAQLDAHTRQRGGGFALYGASTQLKVGLDRLEIERIVWRLLATLAGVSSPGEVLEARLVRDGARVRLDLALPAVLAVSEDDALFRAGASAFPQVIAAGVFGVGFALRLARSEAKAAGGELVRQGPWLRLTLPGLTEAAPSHSPQENQTADGR